MVGGTLIERDDGTGTVKVYEDITPAHHECPGGVLKRMIKPGDESVGKAPIGTALPKCLVALAA
eukprot:2094987-Prymnesium_polylepis.2